MSLPRMSLHIGDYKKDTGHLRAAGHGAYMLLMMHYWATGTLPDDDRQLSAIACMSDKEWKYWGPIIKELFKGNWKVHKRIDQERAEAQAKYERRALAGQKGGEAKAKGKQSSSNATAEAKQPITDNPNHLEERAPERSSGGARKRGTRLPDDFQLSEADIDFAGGHGFAGDPLQAVFSDFCDYWRARAGPHGVKLDWAATWRRWIREESKRKKHQGFNGHGRSQSNRPNGLSLALERLGQVANDLEGSEPILEGSEAAPRLLSNG